MLNINSMKLREKIVLIVWLFEIFYLPLTKLITKIYLMTTQIYNVRVAGSDIAKYVPMPFTSWTHCIKFVQMQSNLTDLEYLIHSENLDLTIYVKPVKPIINVKKASK
jgi:hypothetical protein